MNKAMPGFVFLWLACLTANAEVPRPEHPRPDAFRENWLSLNGTWQFEIDKVGDRLIRGLTSGKDLASTIVVPFCPESKLSGLGLGNSQYFKHVWYRRMFELPPAMKGKRILLHFGGVDYKTWVYVNGHLAGTHTGENAAFAFEITSLLKEGPNELVVRVFDDLRSGLQVGGKQAPDKSEGCVYTRTTGIWQPVWLEAVGSSFVESLSVVPDPDHSRVLIEAAVNGPNDGLTLTAEAMADGRPVGRDTAAGTWRNQRLVLNLSQKKLWEPGSPFLYDLKLTLTRGDQTVDELRSYFGLRKVSIDGRRILINGKPIFQRLILDQGFYPDGVWTAPSDAALRHDIEMSMAAGYNGARLHQKVFEPRFLYWADKLGYLVWGEFPNWGYNLKPDGYAPYVTEWTEVLLRDRNHPAIIGWCPFNETRQVGGRDPAGHLEGDQSGRSDASRAGDQRLRPYRAASGGPRRPRLRRQSGHPPPAVDRLLCRCRSADARPLRLSLDLDARLRRAVHGERDWRHRLGDRRGLGLRRRPEKPRLSSTPATRARSTPCWTIRTCSASATRN